MKLHLYRVVLNDSEHTVATVLAPTRAKAYQAAVADFPSNRKPLSLSITAADPKLSF